MIFLKLCQCLNLTLPLACWQMAQMTEITQMCSGDRKCALVCAGVRRCARVCTGVQVYTSVRCCARLYLGVSGVHVCVRVCAGVRRCALVCTGVRVYTSVRCCAWLYLGVSKCAQLCMCVCECVWDEFSEYLLETRFLTSANYSTHPLRIFPHNSY